MISDALGSVRQLTNTAGEVTYAKSYDPYGVVTQSSGEGQSAYGYSGEQTDSSGMVYLRSRYYSPTNGRFLTKDPSKLERNPYLYVSANPINRIDPTELFSRDIISRSLNQTSFEGVLSEAENYGSWGFIAALLTAEPGDTLAGGFLQIGGFGIPTDIQFRPAVHVDVDGSCNITFNGIPINLGLLPLMLVPSRFGKMGLLVGDGSIWWRDIATQYYKIQKSDTTIVYADGSDLIDYPDFVGGSLGFGVPIPFVGVQGSIFMDRFGGFYFTASVIGGPTSPFEMGYFEGYVGGTKLSKPDLTDALSGFSLLCASANASLFAGISGGGCLFSPNGIAIYSTGLQGGVSLSWSPATFWLGENPSYSWEFAIQDRLNGIRREDLLGK